MPPPKARFPADGLPQRVLALKLLIYVSVSSIQEGTGLGRSAGAMSSLLPRPFPTGATLSIVVLVLLWLGGMPFYFQDVVALLQLDGEVPGSYRLATSSNTLLAASTALYLANLWLDGRGVARLASSLAGLGALGLLTDVALRAFWPEISGRAVSALDSAEYEAVALWVAVATVTWLAVEGGFRLHPVGAFVMPVIMCGVVAEIWLINGSTAGTGFAVFSGLAAYWGQAFIVAQFLGYGAFLLAACLGVLYLLFHDWEPRERAARRAPALWRLYELMVAALSVGLPLFAIAGIMLVGRAVDGSGSGWAGAAVWTPLVLGTYGLLLWLLFRGPMAGPRLAWGSILGFGVTLLGYIAVHLLPGVASLVA
jgi:ABC-type transport system involved in cytochrome c biogenesis permease subunit